MITASEREVAERQLPPSDRTEGAVIMESNAEAAMHTQYRIPGDVVNRATAELPDNQRSAIRKLHAHYVDQALSLRELEEQTGIDATRITQVFRGKYGAAKDGIVRDINRFFDLHEKRSSSKKLEFIETALARKIWAGCETALEFQRIVFVFGESQIGKSTSLRKFRDDHNHGTTIYTEVPAGGALTNFMCKLAGALRVSPKQRRTDLRRRIIESFDERMLLIVDEAHRCIPEERSTSARSIQTIEFLRELHDETGCGLILSATNVFRDEMDHGELGRLLGQTKRRRVLTIQLPDSPPREDLNTFSAAYGLEPAAGEALKLQERVIAEEALGMWLVLLRMGAKVAKHDGLAMRWAHVQTAYAGLRKLAQES